ncbi:ParA family protein [Actinomyces wuliandei]|uniref:ParA family protein n=1 Tax=Actinomyces wuliandei TaxID=2057743 RepID=UPI00111B215E|nr:ParA family protein [Actinomyces wuliandei]
MTTYVIATPKGGVGKTTTAAEVTAALAHTGRTVLAVDLDQQGNLTARLGITPTTEIPGTTADVLAGTTPLDQATTPSPAVPGADVLAGTHALADIETTPPADLVTFLRDELPHHTHRWADTVIDTPPSVGPLTQAGLAAAHTIIAPVTPTVEAYDQLKRLQAVLDARIRRRVNRSAKIGWVVPVMFDSRAATGHGRLLDRDVLDQLSTTWPGRVTPTVRETVTARDAYLDNQPVSTYAPDSPVAADYQAVTTLITQEAPA